MLAVREQLKVFDDDVQLTTFFTLLVLPRVEAKPALDEKWAALTAILVDDFASAGKTGEFDECSVFALLAGLCGVGAIYCETEVADLVSGGEIFELGVAGEVTHQDDFIHVCHGSIDFRK